MVTPVSTLVYTKTVPEILGLFMKSIGRVWDLDQADECVKALQFTMGELRKIDKREKDPR